MLRNKEIKCPYCDCIFKARTNYVDKQFNFKSSHQVSVEKFMQLGGQEIPNKPTIPSLEIRKLRAKLILEEALETIEALGFEPDPNTGEMNECFVPNLVEIVDGCCDLRVVTTGTLSACGVKDLVPQELVDQNNLAKGWTQEELVSKFSVTQKAIDCFDGKDWILKSGDEIYFIQVIENGFKYIVKNSSGKIIKPPSHKKPNLEAELNIQKA